MKKIIGIITGIMGIAAIGWWVARRFMREEEQVHKHEDKRREFKKAA